MSATGHKRVVIADNDPEWVALARFDLDLEGHDVVATCVNGEQAIEACAAHRPDVLVVDYRMPPGVNGVEVTRRVLERDPSIRVVLFTNVEEPAAVDGARKAGAVYVLKGNLRALRAAVAAT